MNWIFYGLLMFFGSVVLYLLVRKASLQKVPRHLVNLAMFAVPLVITLFMAGSSNATYSMPLGSLILLVVAAIIFAYGGNTISLKAIEIAPNPGYSLVLSKSYVLFTTLVSVVLLGGVLSVRHAIAILIIVSFSALIMVNPRQAHKTESNHWVLLSLGAFFAWGLLSLSGKYLFSHGLSPVIFLMYLYSIVTICILVEIRKNKQALITEIKTYWQILLIIGIFQTIFNFGQFMAIQAAPNVGYVNAMNASSIALVTIMSMVIFKDELTLKKGMGILGVTAGLILLLV